MTTTAEFLSDLGLLPRKFILDALAQGSLGPTTSPRDALRLREPPNKILGAYWLKSYISAEQTLAVLLPVALHITPLGLPKLCRK